MCAICSGLNSLIFTCYLSKVLLDDLLNNLRGTITFFVLIFYLGFPKLINVSLDSCDVLITLCTFSIMLKTLSFIMSSPLHLAQLKHAHKKHELQTFNTTHMLRCCHEDLFTDRYRLYSSILFKMIGKNMF